MCPRRIKPPHLELKVVIDTNALFTGSSSNFLKKEVADLISQNSALPDLTIRWIVPEVVRHERQFQMQQAASQMLPTIEKLERLLGHNLNITKEILDARVKEAVDRQVQEHGIAVQPLNSTEVDWPRVILDASYRKPPFQLGEKEKGFRDALILETFLQIVKNSPTSRSVVRLALVSNDQLLRDAAMSRLSSAANVYVLESVDALKDLINTLGSAVDEQFIAAIKERAADVFFKAGDESTLYYKASVRTKLDAALAKASPRLPPGAYKYRVDGWTISTPRFVKKQGQRIYWASRFDATLSALKAVAPQNWATVVTNLGPADLTKASVVSTPNYLSSLQLNPYQSLAAPDLFGSGSGQGEGFQIINSGFEDQAVGHGAASLNASWSLAVTTSGALTKPRLESIDFTEAVWTPTS